MVYYFKVSIMQPGQEKLDELTQRIVDAVHPLRIILFGSAARGEMGRESDLDIAVVVPETFDRRDIAEILYPRLIGVGFAVDLVVVTPDQLARFQSSRSLIYHDILRDGIELYAA